MATLHNPIHSSNITCLVSKTRIPNHSPYLQSSHTPHPIKRRRIITLPTLLFITTTPKPALAFDFGFVAPDQTLEQALKGIKEHAQGLLDIKEYIDSESWKEAQQELRQNAGYLKQDIYTIIQNKAGKERPELRKMYFDLFNDVTGLDYAARDMDKVRVLVLYQKIVTRLDAILSKAVDTF